MVMSRHDDPNARKRTHARTHENTGAANEFVLSRPGLAYTAMAASIVTLLLLLCYRNTYPTNLGLLAIWTLVEAYTISIVTCTVRQS